MVFRRGRQLSRVGISTGVDDAEVEGKEERGGRTMRDIRRDAGMGVWMKNTSEEEIVAKGRRRLRRKGGEKGGMGELTQEEKG